VIWHVDDLKISHVSKDVGASIISILQGEYGSLAPLTETRGTVHVYLGMKIDFSTPGRVRFTMEDYMDGKSPTPAASHLFDVKMTHQ
jgi:hypothetical protein